STSARTPAQATVRAASRSPGTNGARRASARGILRRPGSAASRHGWRSRTACPSARSREPATELFSRRLIIPAGTAESRSTASMPARASRARRAAWSRRSCLATACRRTLCGRRSSIQVSATARASDAGNSTFHSLQLKAEHRFAKGTWLLASYTFAKLLTSTDSVQADATLWSGAYGVISPFERQRNKALALNDVPQTFSLAMIYELPFGRGKRFASSSGAADRLISGWQLGGILRITAGVPFLFRSGTCNTPGQFVAGCIPAVLPGASPFAQSKDGSFDPNRPLFDKAAFESADNFNFYFGTGPRVSNLRGFGYHNQDLNIIKNTRITEKVSLQFRAE